MNGNIYQDFELAHCKYPKYGLYKWHLNKNFFKQNRFKLTMLNQNASNNDNYIIVKLNWLFKHLFK